MAISLIPAASAVSGTLPAANLPTGSVLQVVSTAKTDTFSTTSASYVDVTGLSVSITPKFSTSKILVFFNTSGNGWQGTAGIRLLRGSTNIFLGDTGGSGQATLNFWTNNSDANFRYGLYSFASSFLDSPATTSSTTYKLQAIDGSGNGTFINRSYNDLANRVPSSITVMEIAA